jgi:acetylxylan esterase
MSSSNGVDAWNSTCANGQSKCFCCLRKSIQFRSTTSLISKKKTGTATPQAWANVVKNMYPNYNGSYPKMQIYHGGADTTLRPQNYYETVKTWAGVFGYNYDSPASKQTNSPSNGYTRTTWGPSLQGIFNPNVGHSVPIMGNEDMKFFGFSS